MRTRTSFIMLVVVAVALTGCANNRQLAKASLAMSSGDVEGALKELDVKKRDDLCAKLDRAVYQAALGRMNESNAEFDRALAAIREYESRASVSAREVGRGGATAVANDTVLEYQGEGFEKVLIHAFKARNYMLLGDLSAARVEIRNANIRQDEERKRHQDDIDAAKATADEADINAGALSSQVEERFASATDILARLDNVYQNPFATYLSGVVYEANGDLDDAFIDYKAAYEMVRNPAIGTDVARLAHKLGREAEIDSLNLTSGAAEGNTLVFVDNGLGPQKEEVKFPIPTLSTVLFAAVPITKPIPTTLGEVEVIADDGNVLGRTSSMVDIEAMAVRNLHDRYPAILARQAVRLAVKAVAAEAGRQAAAQAGGDAAGLLVQGFSTLFNAVSEQADLRGWYALPRSIHVVRVTTPPGASHIKLRMLTVGGSPLSELSVPVTQINPGLKIAAVRYINGQTLVASPLLPATQVAASVP